MLIAMKGEINSNTVMGKLYHHNCINGQVIRQKINKETQVLHDTLDVLKKIFIEHSIQKQQNTHFSQVHIEDSPGQITCRP